MMTNTIPTKLDARIQGKKETLDKYRPLPRPVLEKLREQNLVEGTYNSNAIEGNTLTLKETRLVLEQGITISGKSLREHHEATNHRDAIIFLETLLKKKTISEADIKSIHATIVQGIEKDFAGKYRNGQVRILGSSCLPPNYLKIPKLMVEFVRWINKNPEKLNAIELSATAHFRLVEIHPFFDGNGRTARLLMNLILMRFGFPPVVISVQDRKRYYDALSKADKGDFASFATLMAKSVEHALDQYLAAIGRAEPEDAMVPLSKITGKTPYSAEYLSLLARRGELAAEKRGKVWFSSLKAIDEYQKNRERKRN